MSIVKPREVSSARKTAAYLTRDVRCERIELEGPITVDSRYDPIDFRRVEGTGVIELPENAFIFGAWMQAEGINETGAFYAYFNGWLTDPQDPLIQAQNAWEDNADWHMSGNNLGGLPTAGYAPLTFEVALVVDDSAVVGQLRNLSAFVAYIAP